MIFWGQPVQAQAFQKSTIHTGLLQAAYYPLHCAADRDPTLLAGSADLGLCLYPEQIAGQVSKDLCFSLTLILVPSVDPN